MTEHEHAKPTDPALPEPSADQILVDLLQKEGYLLAFDPGPLRDEAVRNLASALNAFAARARREALEEAALRLDPPNGANIPWDPANAASAILALIDEEAK